jgi:pimeloyl-ACP methyl ester carboxylesterase
MFFPVEDGILVLKMFGENQAELKILPHCGHFPHKENPRLLIKSLMEFVA